jgi:UDP-N-acetyl-D-glucosamine dehydrogenase
MLDAMPRKSVPAAGWRRELVATLRDKRAKVGVIGLGYVGLPMLVCVGRAGFRAVGVDLDEGRVDAIRRGRSYVSDVADSALGDLEGRIRVSERYSALKDCDVVLICVPTPLDDGNPDLRHIEGAGRGLAKVLRPGVLVILESTTYPGTTEEVLRPILETSGLRAGRDFALAYSPERIDPGREPDHVAKTPRSSAARPQTRLRAKFYCSYVHEVEL